MAAEAQTSRATIKEEQNFRGILRIENEVMDVLGEKIELYLHLKLEITGRPKV